MITPRVDAHIQLRGHVAFNTLGTRTACGVSMMLRHIVGRRHMALSAEAITLGDWSIAVWIVAIAAHHPSLMHFALYKRSVNVHFIANLTIRPIQRLFNQRQPVRIK